MKSLDELQRLNKENEALADRIVHINLKFTMVLAQKRSTKARTDKLKPICYYPVHTSNRYKAQYLDT
jgi:hypothetical protein